MVNPQSQFEQAWAAGQPKAIEEFLPPQNDPHYLPLLLSLIKAEIFQSWKRWGHRLIGDNAQHATIGPGFHAQEYESRFPRLREKPEYLLELKQAEAEARSRFDEAPSVPGYLIIEELGKGGMGVVYRAQHLKLHGREVALKMILGTCEPELIERFNTETQALARLQHPHIVQVFDAGEVEGQPYFTMELCPGGSLQKKLNGKAQPPRVAAAIVEKLASAVQTLHDANIIHRDLKPGNVLVGADGFLKIADLGLARITDQPGKTQSGVVLGTLAYMAPEQALGNKDVDRPADLYALGAILYECITGRLPFPLNPKEKIDKEEFRRQVIGKEPIPPTKSNPSIHRDLETICLTCLRKEPERRYANAQALASDLSRFLKNEPIEARPPVWWEVGYYWLRRNPNWLLRGAAALFLVLAICFLAFGISQWSIGRDKERETAKAQKEKEQALFGQAKAEHNALAKQLDEQFASANEALERAASAASPALARDRIQEAIKHRTESEQTAAILKVQIGEVIPHAERLPKLDLVIRNEAIRWLLRARINNKTPVRLSDRELGSPTVAVNTSGTHVALHYPRSGGVWLIDPAGVPRSIFKGSPPKRQEQFGGLGMPMEAVQPLAISPDAAWVAIGSTESREVRLVPTAGGDPVRLALHNHSTSSARLEFKNDRLELLVGKPEGKREVAISWVYKNRVWEKHAEAKQPNDFPKDHLPFDEIQRRMGLGFYLPEEQRITSEQYDVSWGTNAGRLYLLAKDKAREGSSSVAWQARAEVIQSRAGSTDERAQALQFGMPGHLVVAVSTKRIIVLDLKNRTWTETPLGEGRNHPETSVVAVHSFEGGFYTLENTDRPHVGGPLTDFDAKSNFQMTAWAINMPRANQHHLTHGLPVRFLDLAADGQLQTGGDEGVVRSWQKAQMVRSFGQDGGDVVRPLAFLEDTSPTRLYANWRFVAAGATFLVERQTPVSSKPDDRKDNGPFAQFGRDFGKDVLQQIPQFALLPAESELYDAKTGKLLHTFPAKGKGRIFRPDTLATLFDKKGPAIPPATISSDGRFAVVVSDEQNDTMDFALWSLETGKSLGNIGTYTKPQHAFQGQSFSAFFSPSGKWLLTARPPRGKSQTFDKNDVEIWKLPECKRVGELSHQGSFQVQFANEKFALLSTSQSANTQAQLIDLEKGTSLIQYSSAQKQLSSLDRPPWVFTEDRAIVLQSKGLGQFDRLGGQTYECHAFNLKDGKQHTLSEIQSQGSPWVDASPDGKRLLIYWLSLSEDKDGEDDKQLQLPRGLRQRAKGHYRLYDLGALKMLKEGTIETGMVAVNAHALQFATMSTAANIASDDTHVYLPSAHPKTRQPQMQSIKWTDGEARTATSELLVEVNRQHGFLLWRGAEGLNWQPRSGGKKVPLVGTTRESYFHQLSPDGKTAVILLPAAVNDFKFGGFADPKQTQPPPNAGLWQLQTGKMILKLSADEAFSAFDPTGRYAATVRAGGQTSRVQIWDLHAGKLHRELNVTGSIDVHTTDPRSTGQFPNQFNHMHLQQAASSTLRQYAVQVHPSGDLVAVSQQGVIQLWDAVKKQPMATIGRHAHLSKITALSQHQGINLVASAAEDGVIHLWDRKSGKLVHHLSDHKKLVTSLIFNADGSRLASAAEDGTVRLWRTDGTPSLWTSSPSEKIGHVRSLVFHRDGRTLIAGTDTGRLLRFDPDKGRDPIREVHVKGSIVALAQTRDGKRLATGTSQGEVALWDADEFTKEADGWSVGMGVNALAFTSSGDHLLTAADTIRVWDRTGREVWHLGAESGPVVALKLGAEDNELVWSDSARRVVRLDLRDLSRQLRETFDLALPGVADR